MGHEWPGRKADSERVEDALVAIIVARSLTTGWAAYELSTNGFGGQAQMLNRSLFEDMVDAHWVTVEPARAAERYRNHFDHSRMLDAVRAQGDDEGMELPTFDAAERRRLDALYGRYGDKSWTGLGLKVRVDAIEHLWKDSDRRAELHRFRRFAHRDNNQTLHLSARGMDALLIEDPTGLRIKTGPQPERLIEATLGTWFLLLETLALSLDHFEVQGQHRKRLENLAQRRLGLSDSHTRELESSWAQRPLPVWKRQQGEAVPRRLIPA